jgi:ESCRT-II complex subunit VPS22
MRRGVGVGALKKHTESKTQYKQVADQLEQSQISYLTQQTAEFQKNLELFASKHKAQINANPIFRNQFSDMCSKLGVDPLASNKGFWSSLLGLGDFYYELGVQIADIAIKTRNKNGGLLSMEELLTHLKKIRNKPHHNTTEICEGDIIQAVKKLTCLGNGFNVLKLQNTNKTLIKTVPTELNRDHCILLELAVKVGGYFNNDMIEKELGTSWSNQRLDTATELMIKQGMIWIDYHNNLTTYWFPSLFLSQRAQQGNLTENQNINNPNSNDISSLSPAVKQ